MRTLLQNLFVVSATLACAFISGVNTGQARDDEGPPNTLLRQIDTQSWKLAYNENKKLLVLIYPTGSCGEPCQSAHEILSAIIDQPEIPADAEITYSTDLSLAQRLDVSQYPGLVYLREKSHVLYDGQFEVEELIAWIQQASERATHVLNDDSFEHLTQASTGATTGDWLVAFYTNTCPTILTTLETLGVRLKGRTNVAKVNSADNSILTDRFHISKCPEIILFKQGKMYRYDLPMSDVAALKSFVGGFYKNSRGETVPGQKSGFDHLTEAIAQEIKMQLSGKNRPLVLALLGGSAVLLFGIMACCCRSVAKDNKTIKKE